MPLGEPETQGEEVKLIFDLLDVDHSGKIDAEEMKRVLLSLNFSQENVHALIDQFDKNKDGELSIVEFWSWVNGHDGRQTDGFRPQLLNMAVAENKRKISETEERLAAFRSRKEAEEAKAAEEAKRQEEREQGLRFSREDFVRQKMEAGFSKAVAEELYSKCDQDRDGEVNYQDIGWLVSDNLATVEQVKQTYQKGVQKKVEDVSWSEDWKADVSKLLKRRGFKEEEEGLKYHAKNAAGETIALKEILKDKTASLDSKNFPITLHLQASNVTVVDCDEKGLGQLVDTFLAWDKNGDGSVSSEEMSQVLKQVNPKFTEVTLKKIFAEIDVNGDGVIDLQEFVSWLSGENLKKKKMKKKAKEEQDSKIALTLHRKRAEEAKELKLLDGFMQAMSSGVQAAIQPKKLEVYCGKLNPGSNATCSSCSGRHGWVCHACGFVSFWDTCINDCSVSSYGWTCLSGKCPKKKCGCKKKPDFWQRSGFTCTMATVALDVEHIIASAKTAAG
ncbi:CMD1 [Symbiodinium natans]|uniref:CMD1 protein n=1 Tax=Symbiodinium natans TaxID=878477 RepID=A0A812M378_9DINO|nr:CMD1 [Symbiodinium natans]